MQKDIHSPHTLFAWHKCVLTFEAGYFQQYVRVDTHSHTRTLTLWPLMVCAWVPELSGFSLLPAVFNNSVLCTRNFTLFDLLKRAVEDTPKGKPWICFSVKAGLNRWSYDYETTFSQPPTSHSGDVQGYILHQTPQSPGDSPAGSQSNLSKAHLTIWWL